MMKNLVKALAVIILVCGVSVAYAQQKATKLGHINFSELVTKMPGQDTVKISLDKFVKELQDQYSAMSSELDTKAKEFDAKSKELSDFVKATKQKELQDLNERMQTFAQNSDQVIAAKRQELLNPFIEKARKAIADVSKENGFAYIFDELSLLYVGGGEDVTPLVKKKLNMN